MKEYALDDVLVRRFLLGELSPGEQAEVEEQAFVDSERFAFIQEAADDLIDEFLYDDLSTTEKERFEHYFLSQPGRREDLKIAQALQKHVTQLTASAHEQPREARSLLDWLKSHVTLLRLSLAAAVLVIVTIGVWLAVSILRQNRPAPIQVQKQTPQSPTPANNDLEAPKEVATSPKQKENQPKPPPSNQPPAPVYSFVLIPVGPVRGESNITTVQLPSASAIARLQLPLIGDSSYRSYQASLIRDDGKVIRKWKDLGARGSEFGRAIQINVPGDLFERQQRYRVLLRGISSDGSAHDLSNYHFKVGN
jgi:hypothetical protein